MRKLVYNGFVVLGAVFREGAGRLFSRASSASRLGRPEAVEGTLNVTKRLFALFFRFKSRGPRPSSRWPHKTRKNAEGFNQPFACLLTGEPKQAEAASPDHSGTAAGNCNKSPAKKIFFPPLVVFPGNGHVKPDAKTFVLGGRF